MENLFDEHFGLWRIAYKGKDRPNLCGVHVETFADEAQAADGHLVLCVPMLSGDRRLPFTIPTALAKQGEKMHRGSREIEAPTVKELQAAANAAADTLLGGEEAWTRRIFVSVLREERPIEYRDRERCVFNSVTLQFRAERAWIRVDADGNTWTRRWDRRSREARGVYRPPDGPDLARWRPPHGIELPYTDDTWTALQVVGARVAALRAQLVEILGNEEAIAALGAHSAALALEVKT